MSKNSHKCQFREQEGRIKHLETLNHHLMMRLKAMTLKQYKQYAVAMCCIYQQTQVGDLTDELAGELMLAMTDTWDFSCE